jgi:hypothetical protein
MLIDVVLELDDVRVWDGLGIDRAENGSGLVVDGADAETSTPTPDMRPKADHVRGRDHQE